MISTPLRRLGLDVVGFYDRLAAIVGIAIGSPVILEVNLETIHQSRGSPGRSALGADESPHRGKWPDRVGSPLGVGTTERGLPMTDVFVVSCLPRGETFAAEETEWERRERE